MWQSSEACPVRLFQALDPLSQWRASSRQAKVQLWAEVIAGQRGAGVGGRQRPAAAGRSRPLAVISSHHLVLV